MPLDDSRRSDHRQPDTALPERLTRLAFGLTLALVLARATMLEELRAPFQVQPATMAPPGGPGPGSAIVLDLLCCLPALLVFARRLLDRQYILRWTLSQVAFAILAAVALASAGWATDRFAAVINAAHLATAAIVVWSTAQLVPSWLRFRWVVALAGGLMIACAAQGLIYRAVDVPDMRESIRRNWDTILRQNGWSADSYVAQRFRQKAEAGEMIVTTASPNTYAAVLVMLIVATLGVTMQRFADREAVWWALLPLWGVPLSGVAIAFTQSKTAYATTFLAMAALLGIWWARDWLQRRSKLAFALGAIVSACVAAIVIAYGLLHDSLVIDSLTFRWRYWVASAMLFAQRPWVGVGWSNFGPHYLAVRLPVSAEEIKDPHNLFVRFFVELGVIGGVLAIVWIARAAWELTRPILPAPQSTDAAKSRRPQLVGFFAIVAGGVVVVSTVFGLDFQQHFSFVFVELCKRALTGCLIFAGGLLIALRSPATFDADDRPAPWMLSALLVALGVFLVHNLVDFAFFETGPMLLFAMLLGAALGVRQPSAAGHRRGDVAAVAGTSIAMLVWLVGGTLLAPKVVTAQRHAAAGDALLRAGRPADAAARLGRAYFALSINADYALRAARALAYAGADLRETRAMLTMAIETDPTLIPAYLMRSAAALGTNPPDVEQAMADSAQVVALDPNDVATRIGHADLLARIGRPAEAAMQYEQALHYNDLFSPDEPKRLPPQQVQEIKARIDAIRRGPSRNAAR